MGMNVGSIWEENVLGARSVNLFTGHSGSMLKSKLTEYLRNQGTFYVYL
jgi:hypothetical protein